jgi:hypothetical protein
VGIDAYPAPEHRLGGCVNDAHAWAAALRGLQFDVRLLLDGQATRAGLEQALRGLLAQSRPGDVLVFQFAGHGTHVADLDGDEADGRDEALCPVDFASGALFIDDDVAAVFEQLPAGVSLTCFTDCCHSGTNTRFAAGRSRAATALPAGARARFVPPTAVLEAAHRHYRRGMRSGSVSTGGREAMRHVKFSACRDDEVALESGGSGDFTLRAVRVLQSGLHGLTNAGFLDAVRREFGSAARQEPLLDCSTEARTALLLQPWAGGRQQVVAAGSGGLVQAVQALALAVQALAAAQPRP